MGYLESMLFNFQIFGNLGLLKLCANVATRIARNPHCITIVPLGSRLSFKVIKNKEEMIFYFLQFHKFQEILPCVD